MRYVSTVLAVLVLLGAGSFSPLAADEDPATRVLKARLAETKVSLSVADQEFGTVLELLKAQTGLNLVIDPRIESDVRENPVTTLHVEDLALATVLDMLANAGGEEVVWVVRGNVVLYTHRHMMDERLAVRIYPVAALTMGRNEFHPPEHALVGSEEDEEGDPFLPFGSADELIELLKMSVEPPYWEETEHADIRPLGEGRLVAKAAPRIHEGIHRFLGGLTAMEPSAIRVEIRAVAGEQAAEPPAKPEAGPTLCLTVRSGMQSTAFVGERRAYVAGYDARFAGSVSESDPRVETLVHGMAARVRARPAPGDLHLHLDLDVAIAELGKEIEHGTDAGAPITLPGRKLVRRQGDLLVKPGTWHWMEGRTGGVDAGSWGFLVRATPVRTEPGADLSPVAFQIPSPQPSPDRRLLGAQRIEEVLWTEASLDDVVSNLRTLTGLNFYLTPRLRMEVYEEVVISLNLVGASLSTILDLVTAPYELEWRARENLITLDVRYDQGPDMDIRYFDMKDLVWHFGDEDRDDQTFEIEALVDLVRETVGNYDVWEDPASIEARNGILIARNSPPVLDAVQGLLDGLRTSRTQIVTIVDQLDTDDATAEAILGGPGGGGCTFILDERAQAALSAAIEAGAVTRLSQERVVSVEGSGSPKTSGEEIRYVRDYEIRVSAAEDALTPVREVKTLHSGTTLHLRTAPTFRGDQVYLEVVLERAVLSEMGQTNTPYGPIDLPRQEVWNVRTGLHVPDGRTALVAASRADGRWRLLLVTPRRVPLDR